ncbi:hypothetical protein [Fibrella aquatica]|uniref:hypothetical protein n=1 Tax=Fibrella aquatica TaxID=3242487 RepID=UPI003520D259
MYYRYLLCFGLLVAGCAGALGQVVKKKPAVVPPFTLDEVVLRQAIFDTAATYVGRTERTDRNDAPWIAEINRYNHLPTQAMYCASGYYYVHAKNGVKLPVKSVGYVRVYFADATKVIYRKNQRGNHRVGKPIQRMDAVSLYVSHIEGIAQQRYDPDEDDTVLLIGFNTTGGKGTKGGCYINRRRTSEIKVIANWLTPYLAQFKKPPSGT